MAVNISIAMSCFVWQVQVGKQVDCTDQDSKPAKDQRNIFVLYCLCLFECNSDEV